MHDPLVCLSICLANILCYFVFFLSAGDVINDSVVLTIHCIRVSHSRQGPTFSFLTPYSHVSSIYSYSDLQDRCNLILIRKLAEECKAVKHSTCSWESVFFFLSFRILVSFQICRDLTITVWYSKYSNS